MVKRFTWTGNLSTINAAKRSLGRLENGQSTVWERPGVFSRLDWWVGSCLYAVNLIAHLILLGHPPALFFYNLDELDLTFSCLDRFLGVPSTIMMEPSSVLQMFSVPVFLADFIARRGVPSSQSRMLEAFSPYLADAYADPRHHVILVRALVAVAACTGPVLLFAICRKLGAGKLPSLLCAVVFSLHRSFFGQSLLAAGDSVGLTAVLGAALVLLQTRKGLEMKAFAGFLYGMAIALKLTMASSLVLLLAFFWADPALRSPRRITWSLAYFGMGSIAGILLWWPYVWIEPLRTAKAILGNVNKVGSRTDWLVFLTRFQESAGTAFVVFAVLAVVMTLWGWRRVPDRGLLLALLCSAIVTSIPLVMRATSTFPRYLMPLALAPLLCFVLITRKSPLFSVTVLTLLALAMAVNLVRQQTALRIPNGLISALEVLPRLPAGVNAYLPEDAAMTYAFRLPQSTYQRISVHAREELYLREGVVSFLRDRNISENAIQTLVTDFNEDEQANAAHTAVAAESRLDSNIGANIFLYRTHGTDRTSWAEIDRVSAVETLRGRDSAAVLIGCDGSKFGKVFWRRGNWCWFNNDSASGAAQ